MLLMYFVGTVPGVLLQIESAILRLKPMKHDGRVGLRVVAKCLVCAQITRDACFVHCALTDWRKVALVWMSHWEESKTLANYFALHVETLSILREKQTGLWKPSGARQGAPIWKLRAWGILKCTPAVDICHLAPGIINVGIWHWQQGWSSTFIDNEEGGRIFPLCPRTDLTIMLTWLLTPRLAMNNFTIPGRRSPGKCF